MGVAAREGGVKYLLDSNVVIAATLGIGGLLRRRLAEWEEGDLVTSTIVYAEVMFGSVRGKPPPIEQLHVFLDEIPMLDFGAAAASAYASLPLRRGSFDRLIAAHALALGIGLVTSNVDDFRDIAGLVVEDWTR